MNDKKNEVRIKISAVPASLIDCLRPAYQRRAREAVQLHATAPTLFRALVAVLSTPATSDDPATIVRRALARNFAERALMLAAGVDDMESLVNMIRDSESNATFSYDLRPGGKRRGRGVLFVMGAGRMDRREDAGVYVVVNAAGHYRKAVIGPDMDPWTADPAQARQFTMSEAVVVAEQVGGEAMPHPTL